MICRRRDAVVGVLLLGVIAFAMWIAGRDSGAAAGAPVDQADGSDADSPMLRGKAVASTTAARAADSDPEAGTPVEEKPVLKGRVLDGAGAGVPGTTVHAYGLKQGWHVAAKTDAQGRFRLPEPPEETTRLDVRPPRRDGCSDLETVLDIPVSMGASPLEVRLRRKPRVHFRLRVKAGEVVRIEEGADGLRVAGD